MQEAYLHYITSNGSNHYPWQISLKVGLLWQSSYMQVFQYESCVISLNILNLAFSYHRHYMLLLDTNVKHSREIDATYTTERLVLSKNAPFKCHDSEISQSVWNWSHNMNESVGRHSQTESSNALNFHYISTALFILFNE